MGVHPDNTASRAVDACGGSYSAEEREERWADGHKAALDAASEAVKAADALTAELLEALKALHLKTVVGTDDERHAALNAAWAVITKAESGQ